MRLAVIVLGALSWVGLTNGGTPGEVDPAFVTGSGANALVWSVAVDANGRFVIGGNFTSFDGQPRSYVARILPDGRVDRSFNPQVNGYVRVVRMQPNQTILIGGDFTEVNGTHRNRIARLNPNGSLDATFDPGSGAEGYLLEGPCHLFDAVLQADGKIILGGTFVKFNGMTKNCIVRLHPDGAVDESFLTGTGAEDDWVRGLLLLPDGKILVCGWFQRFNGQACSRMIRLNADGTRDAAFAPEFGPHDPVYQMALHEDGRLTIVGHFSTVNGYPRHNVARLNPDGTTDARFDSGAGANGYVESVMALPGGRALIAGYFSAYDGQPAHAIALVERDGSRVASFETGPRSSASYLLGMKLEEDGTLVVWGDFEEISREPRGRIARVFGPRTLIALAPRRWRSEFQFDVITKNGKTYDLLGSPSSTGPYETLQTIIGDGSLKTFRQLQKTNAMLYMLRER